MPCVPPLSCPCSVRMLGLAFLLMAGLGAMVEERGLRWGGLLFRGRPPVCTPHIVCLAATPTVDKESSLSPPVFAPRSGSGSILDTPDLRPQSEPTPKFADVKGVDEAKVRRRAGCWRMACHPSAAIPSSFPCFGTTTTKPRPPASLLPLSTPV